MKKFQNYLPVLLAQTSFARIGQKFQNFISTQVYPTWNIILFAFLLLFVGCKKDNEFSPENTKRIVTETTDSGDAAQYEYEDNGRIKRIVTSDGTDISFQSVTDVFSAWDGRQFNGLAIIDNNSGVTIYYYVQSYGYYAPASVRLALAVESQAWSQSFEYNDNDNLTRSMMVFQQGVNIPDQIAIYSWEAGNITSSVIQGVTNTYEYYTDKANMLSNEYFGKGFLGVSSKNLLKREVSHSSAGDLITDYVYEFEDDNYVRKVTTSVSDQDGNVINTNWRLFTYE